MEVSKGAPAGPSEYGVEPNLPLTSSLPLGDWGTNEPGFQGRPALTCPQTPSHAHRPHRLATSMHTPLGGRLSPSPLLGNPSNMDPFSPSLQVTRNSPFLLVPTDSLPSF